VRLIYSPSTDQNLRKEYNEMYMKQSIVSIRVKKETRDKIHVAPVSVVSRGGMYAFK